MAQLWERQPGEGVKAFHAFVHYRDMGAGRSIDAAYRQHRTICQKRQVSAKGAASGRWDKWSSENNWQSRAAAYDTEQDRKAQEKHQKRLLDVRERHAQFAAAALSVLLTPVKAILDELAQNPKAVEELRKDEKLAGLLEKAIGASKVAPGLVNIERLALGLSTEQVEVEQKKDDPTAAAIAGDPEATKLAIALLSKLAGPDPAPIAPAAQEPATPDVAGA